MNDLVAREDPFHVEATEAVASNATRVLKHGESFAIFDRQGDIGVFGRRYQGLFHDGTRHLSYLQLKIGEQRPVLLSSTLKKDNLLLAVDMMNPDMYREGELTVAQGNLHYFRAKFLWNDTCYERIKITNFQNQACKAEFVLQFSADFADIFELRGIRRTHRGEYLPPRVERDRIVLGYRGLDGIERFTAIAFSRVPNALSESEARFSFALEANRDATVFVFVTFSDRPAHIDYDLALERLRAELRDATSTSCCVSTSDLPFNEWIERSSVDLHTMITHTPAGPYPYAGVPWYSTVFGRDGLITALECLWLRPEMARGVLRYLAEHQAREVDVARDAEPGKILHEVRRGEMANLGEVPFQRYYGSVDSTPLFVMLAAAYYERTGDLALVRELWPAIEAALRWIDQYGDGDGDGFVEYQRRSADGLVNQGWKDSHDALFDHEGRLAQGSVALCEVQGYVYAAKQGAAQMAAALGRTALAAKLIAQADALKQKFDEAFWCEDIGTYAIALDGEKRPLRVATSNAGHALYTGIASEERAASVARTLLNPESFSGWGVRTVATSARNYNPMSYHNGSVWPHDNALIAAGLARYGFKREALAITVGMFETSRYVDLNRLPELFCGFLRRPDEAPTLYPVACSPQAWAAGAVFLFLEACLGLRVTAMPKPAISFHAPLLPDFLKEVRIDRLVVGGAHLDLAIRRFREDVAVHIVRRSGEVNVVVIK